MHTSSYMHISWKAFKLLQLFFEAIEVSWLIWQSNFDRIQIILINSSTAFYQEQCKENSLINFVTREISHLKYFGNLALFFIVKIVENKKKNQALTSFSCPSKEIRLVNSRKRIYKTNQDSIISHTRENSKKFNLTSKYFSILKMGQLKLSRGYSRDRIL